MEDYSAAYFSVLYLTGEDKYLWRGHVARCPCDESHGESSRLLGLSGDVA